jgi:hypothetical protein
MKSTLLLFFLSGIVSVGFTQSFSSLALLILDKETKKPVSGAKVVIKETGWTGKQTGADGKVFFEKSVPVGAITYLVTKDGYLGGYGEMNITIIEKDNSLSIELTKSPEPSEDKLLIRGTVTDKDEKDLEDATVEVSVGEITQTAYTDRNGNYKFIIPLTKNSFPETGVDLKAQYRGQCKKSERISIPKNNIIIKDFNLVCSPVGYQTPGSSSGASGTSTTSPGVVLKKETVAGVEITVNKCEVSGNKLTCYLTYQNTGTKPIIGLRFESDWSKMIDEKGNTYASNVQSISNMVATQTYLYVDYELARGVVAKGTIEFLIDDANVKKIARLEIKNESSITHYFTDLPVTR